MKVYWSKMFTSAFLTVLFPVIIYRNQQKILLASALKEEITQKYYKNRTADAKVRLGSQNLRWIVDFGFSERTPDPRP